MSERVSFQLQDDSQDAKLEDFCDLCRLDNKSTLIFTLRHHSN